MKEKTTVALNEKLEQAVQALGTNPFEEPEVYAALDETPLKKSQVVKLVLKRHGLKQKDFSAMEIARFFHAIDERVAGVKNDDGSFKTTPGTENFELPDFEQVEELTELTEKIASQDEDNADWDELSAALKRLDELVWESTGLDKTKLTDWEQKLMGAQIFACAIEVEKTSVGKL
jgi:hypothetical protein